MGDGGHEAGGEEEGRHSRLLTGEFVVLKPSLFTICIGTIIK
jgi:hypothetical protein